MDVEPAVKLKARPRTCFASSVITAAAACVLEAPAQQRVARRCAGAAAQLRRPPQGAIVHPQASEQVVLLYAIQHWRRRGVQAPRACYALAAAGFAVAPVLLPVRQHHAVGARRA